MTYDSLDLKKPVESDDYQECSEFIVTSIESIMQDAMDAGRNKIVINTNLKLGIPMENVNKIAGSFVEAWAFEVFTESLEIGENKYELVNVEAGERLNMADVILQFKKKRTTWEFCALLDRKFIASKKGYDQWLEYAEQNDWIK